MFRLRICFPPHVFRGTTFVLFCFETICFIETKSSSNLEWAKAGGVGDSMLACDWQTEKILPSDWPKRPSFPLPSDFWNFAHSNFAVAREPKADEVRDVLKT